MADIKEKQRAPIKILDKSIIGTERIKNNLVDVKDKTNSINNEQSQNGENYAVNRIETNSKQLSKKTISSANDFGEQIWFL